MTSLCEKAKVSETNGIWHGFSAIYLKASKRTVTLPRLYCSSQRLQSQHDSRMDGRAAPR